MQSAKETKIPKVTWNCTKLPNFPWISLGTISLIYNGGMATPIPEEIPPKNLPIIKEEVNGIAD